MCENRFKIKKIVLDEQAKGGGGKEKNSYMAIGRNHKRNQTCFAVRLTVRKEEV